MKYDDFGQEIFLNRELSWLDFNARVLDEAGYKANGLFDRLKFISIFSSNLDEFFMVRIAGLCQLAATDNKKICPAGFTPEEQLNLAREKIIKLLKRQNRYLNREILPELEKYKLRLRKVENLPAAAKKKLKHIFHNQIFPVLTPIAVDPAHPFPLFNNGAIEIAANIRPRKRKEPLYAFVEVPLVLPRFIRIDDKLPGTTFIQLEDLIMSNLDMLFMQAEIIEYSPFRIIRDMDFSIHENLFRDFLNGIEKTLLESRSREPVCLIIPTGMPKNLREWLCGKFSLDPISVYTINNQLALEQFCQLAEKAPQSILSEPLWPPLPHPDIKPGEPVFKSLSEKKFISLFFPYHSFAPVVCLLEEAAEDPSVLAIKQTLYRVSGDSPIVRALQRAAENGKQVTVIVELKARFDEDNNILWARRLEESGAHVIYGISGLKIHCKALLIIRKEEGIIRRYTQLSTGNYNDKTASTYTDISILTTDTKLCNDISALFNLMTGYSESSSEWQKITISPFDLREKFISLIEREIKHSTPAHPGHIIAKMNSLVDPKLIKHIYHAAHAGVKIELIVRGICCLRPGVGTDNIKVISIIDRFLEHERIYYFSNNGTPEYYLSSADWMPRNLDRRIELLFPVDHTETCEILRRILDSQLNDKEKGRELRSDGTYTRHSSHHHSPCRSQYKIYRMLKKHLEQKNSEFHRKLKILSPKTRG
jgi:polyphosphate kinase